MKNHSLRQTLVGMLFFLFIIFYRLYESYINIIHIPVFQKNIWIFYLSTVFFLIEILAWIGLFFWKKWSVFIFPFFIFIETIIYLFIFNELIKLNLLALFWFIGFGLIQIIIDWTRFK